MKTLLYTLGLVLTLTSCGTTHFYSTLNTSNENLAITESGDFIYEDDIVHIVHSFHGEGAPVLIDIYNKTNDHLYIDWQLSALITDDRAISYAGKEVSISGLTQTNTYSYNRHSSDSYGSFSGVASLPQNTTFIPPRSSIKYSSLSLTGSKMDYKKIIEDKSLDRNMMKANMLKKDEYPAAVKIIDFNESESPLKFRSYLTLYAGEARKPITVDVDFYVSHLVKSKSLSPQNMQSSDYNRGDLFYTSKVNNTGATIAGTTILGGLLVVGVIAGVNADEPVE